jgi:DNA-binding PadR family transcriptional regulator
VDGSETKISSKYVILDLVKEKPRYGYEIIRELEERSHGFYTPSPGVVYPTLQMLEETGYTTSTEQDGKRIYTITEGGQQFLVERSRLADEVRSQMKRHWDPSNSNIDEISEILDELVELGRTLHRRLHQAESEKIQRIHKLITIANQEIKTMLKE